MKRMIVIMGVAGSGKTTVGKALAEATGIVFRDGDDLHSQGNIEKMASGIPLTDEDRWPWLERVGTTLAEAAGDVAVGCSALKRSYRDRIRQKANGPVTFVYLQGSKDLISRRMSEREGHFMPTALVDSQFAALEPPGPDENAIAIDISEPGAQLVARLKEHFMEENQ
ncbi:MAG: gluconokinase [Hoeflea sp.]|uniref:gluconokinase n=1 Tax=Hoeflea sp. TaxID=1940281 RepID=UPI0032EEF715